MSSKGALAVTIAVIFTLSILAASVFYAARYGLPSAPWCSTCDQVKEVSFVTVYPEKPIVEQPNPDYLKDKLGVMPKTFPYERVDLDPSLEGDLVKILGGDQPLLHIASFSTGNSQYISLFEKNRRNSVLIVSWALDGGTKKVNIIQIVTEELKYLGGVSNDLKQTNGVLNNNVSYRIVGGADYYELDIQIASMTGSQITGTLYHVYDWTRTEGKHGWTLVYSVTSAGWFWVNYGVEVWIDQDVSYDTIHDSNWVRCWFRSWVVADHRPSASIRAEGQASRWWWIGPYVNIWLWATVSVDYYLQGYHNGGGNTWNTPTLCGS